MFPDPKWLDALKLPLKTTFAVALAATALFVLEWIQVLDFGSLSAYTRVISLVVAVVFWALTTVGVADQLFAHYRERRRRKEVLVRLDTLSAEEIRYVADALRTGAPSFFAYAYSSPVALLQGKALVWTPGGTHHQDHYPYSFHEFVWAELVNRKSEFLEKDEAIKRAAAAAEEASRRRRRY